MRTIPAGAFFRNLTSGSTGPRLFTTYNPTGKRIASLATTGMRLQWWNEFELPATMTATGDIFGFSHGVLGNIILGIVVKKTFTSDYGFYCTTRFGASPANVETIVTVPAAAIAYGVNKSLAVVWDNTTHKWLVYSDYVLVGEASVNVGSVGAWNPTVSATTFNFNVWGPYTSTAAGGATTTMGSVQFWNDAGDSAAIEDDAKNEPTTPYASTLINYIPFSESSGTTVTEQVEGTVLSFSSTSTDTRVISWTTMDVEGGSDVAIVLGNTPPTSSTDPMMNVPNYANAVTCYLNVTATGYVQIWARGADSDEWYLVPPDTTAITAGRYSRVYQFPANNSVVGLYLTKSTGAAAITLDAFRFQWPTAVPANNFNAF